MTKDMKNTMADTKLFNIKGTVKEYQSGTVTLEKELQTVIENNMNIFFGVTFLVSEYRTTDGGRMDSIGIDENHCPVIFEYKRSVKENVINQGLFYLNWLLDHKDSFKVLVIEKLGLKAANNIDWSMPRVVCVAGDFTKYDESAIKQMNRNISLIRYKKFGEDLLMFEQVNENVVSAIPDNEPVSKTKATIAINKNGIDARVCPHVSKLNPTSNPEITGAMILTEIMATIARNKTNSLPFRGNFI